MARTAEAVAEPLPILPPGAELVTPEQLAAAETAAQAAAGKLAEQELRPANKLDLGDLALKARRADLELTRLRDARAAQDRLAKNRAKVEKETGPLAAELVERLEASRSGVAAAVVEAEEALRRLVEAAEGHGAVVRQASEELVDLGLLASDVFGEHDTGGTADGKGVRLAGKWWAAADGSGLFCRSVAAVAVWAWGDAHPVSALRRDFRVHSAVQQAAAILKDVPTVPPRNRKAG